MRRRVGELLGVGGGATVPGLGAGSDPEREGLLGPGVGQLFGVGTAAVLLGLGEVAGELVGVGPQHGAALVGELVGELVGVGVAIVPAGLGSD